MFHRLRCLLTGHQTPSWRMEWHYGHRLVYAEICYRCGMQVRQGNSDEWIIPQAFVDGLADYFARPNPYRQRSG